MMNKLGRPPRVYPIHLKKRSYIVENFWPSDELRKKYIDPRSIRHVFPPWYPTEHRLIVGCPRGHWHPERPPGEQCDVSMVPLQLWHPIEEEERIRLIAQYVDVPIEQVPEELREDVMRTKRIIQKIDEIIGLKKVAGALGLMRDERAKDKLLKAFGLAAIVGTGGLLAFKGLSPIFKSVLGEAKPAVNFSSVGQPLAQEQPAEAAKPEEKIVLDWRNIGITFAILVAVGVTVQMISSVLKKLIFGEER